MRLGQKGGLLDPVLREAFGPRPYPEPCAIGHECVAEVVEVGPAITSVAVGDKVVVPYPVSCGQCDACRRGLTGRCATTRRDVLGQVRHDAA
ncbi:alcohol dehydrogenase catalytic domain-containing protein [Mycobacteroides chelonae]|uniref:alcohol dehydrogenase catalytic domain-containing protein n=1 Tax=Mycobacteroides chelonae TaxID=1774 RepID=UPI001F0AEB32|nr:alcohol dehydrogenase catalytic domain-containing protein [Mycobacteroides chelonae]